METRIANVRVLIGKTIPAFNLGRYHVSTGELDEKFDEFSIRLSGIVFHYLRHKKQWIDRPKFKISKVLPCGCVDKNGQDVEGLPSLKNELKITYKEAKMVFDALTMHLDQKRLTRR